MSSPPAARGSLRDEKAQYRASTLATRSSLQLIHEPSSSPLNDEDMDHSNSESQTTTRSSKKSKKKKKKSSKERSSSGRGTSSSSFATDTSSPEEVDLEAQVSMAQLQRGQHLVPRGAYSLPATGVVAPPAAPANTRRSTTRRSSSRRSSSRQEPLVATDTSTTTGESDTTTVHATNVGNEENAGSENDEENEPVEHYYEEEEEEAGRNSSGSDEHNEREQMKNRRGAQKRKKMSEQPLWMYSLIFLALIFLALVGIIVGVTISRSGGSGSSSTAVVDSNNTTSTTDDEINNDLPTPGTQECELDAACRIRPDHTWPPEEEAAGEDDPFVEETTPPTTAVTDNNNVTWYLLSYETFDDGLGIWNLGVHQKHSIWTEGNGETSSDPRSYSIQIEYGDSNLSIEGIEDSSVYTNALAVSTYARLRVSFNYLGLGLESGDEGEGFFLESSPTGSFSDESSWTSHYKFVYGSDFTGVGVNQIHSGEVVFDIPSQSSNSIVLRFRCFTTNPKHKVYLDNISIEAAAAT